MIYLFKVEYYSEEEENNKLTLLKLGYSSRLVERMKSHLTSQPRLEMVGWKEGSKENELELHERFKEFRYKDTKEWYVYNEEIVKEFIDGSFKGIETLNSTFIKFFGLSKLGNKAFDVLDYVKEKSIELNLQEEFNKYRRSILSRIMEFSIEMYNSIYYKLTSPILNCFPEILVDDGETKYEVEYTRLGPKIIKDNLSITLTMNNVIDDVLDLSRDDTHYTIITGDEISRIVDIIKKYNLSPDQVNILCEDTEKNRNTIKNRLGKSYSVGHEPRKTITLCTRTVYLGADFYSDNARSIVISDANIECMAVDITLDLPQILGRQRLDENPWRNEIEIYVKCIMPGNVQLREEFEALKRKKKEETGILLSIYENSNVEQRNILINRLEDLIDSLKFRKDYVAVNNHAGSHKIPVENKLVEISEERAFDIQQVDYSSRFLVFSTIKNALKLDSINEVFSESESVEVFLNKYKNCKTSSDRLKVVCTFKFHNKEDQREAFLNYVPLSYRDYYYGLGPDRCRELGYNISNVKKELGIVYFKEGGAILNDLNKIFIQGEKYTKSSIKSKLKEIYSSRSYNKTAKASDLSEWFEISPCKLKNSDTGKWENGFEVKGIKK